MSKFFRRTALLVGIIAMSVMGLVGFYSAVLPDSYNVSKDGELMINSLFSISARPCESKVTVAISENSSYSSRTSYGTLLLFGAVPIKDVTERSIDRPMLVPCGQAFGIKLLTDGVMVVDFSKVDDKCPAKECGIKEGDVIISVNGQQIKSNADISKAITNSKGEPCSVVLKRDGNEKTLSLTPVFSGGTYKAGMWVRDSSAGIGTLTFYDEETGCFGGLGHPVCDSDTKETLPLSEGVVGDIRITGCTRSTNGDPGQLLGEFASSASLGSILANCSDGVFGTLNVCPSDEPAVELGFRQEIKRGDAEIICSVDGGEAKHYKISIEQIHLDEQAEHDLVIKVTDPELIEKTGGIVQGMSGSPIIQNGRLVGAVTHVFIDDPTMGYGIFADQMYQSASVSTEDGISKAG